MTIKQFINAFTPRFITETVAFQLLDDGYHIIAPMWLLDDGESYDATGEMRSFNLFGWAIFPRLLGKIDTTPGRKNSDCLSQ